MNPARGENAVIVDDDGKYGHFRVKCPYCGAVEGAPQAFAILTDRGQSAEHHPTCSKCRKSFKVIIRRG